MKRQDELKHELIQEFGQAYKAFGLNSLMGHIVAILLYSPRELSLDEITDGLGRSKGPVSQIIKRLTNRNLIRNIWKPGSRKAYFAIEENVFANAFRNTIQLVKNNTRIANTMIEMSQEIDDPDLEPLKSRLDEMKLFYELMEKKYNEFLAEWAAVKTEFKEKKK